MVSDTIKKEKHKRIKNRFYVEFLEKGQITYLNREHILMAESQITGKYKDMGRNILYLAYLTGARPVELLSLKGKDVERSGSHLKIQVPAAKNGLSRPVYLKMSDSMVKDIYNYCITVMPEMYLHWAYRGQYKRNVLNKKGEIKEYKEISRPLRYHFSKWFKGVLGNEDTVVPYHLRHNRFSKLSEKGISMEDLRLLKGAKTFASITPYVHLSSERGKNIAKKIE